MTAIKSVIYVSTARPDMTEDDILALKRHAEERNRKADITGALGYNGINFMQLLEGRRQEVFDCLERISKDDRHSGMIVINQRDMAQREFDQWAMMFSRFSKDAPTPDAQMKEWLATGKVTNETRSIFGSFQSLGVG